MPAYLVLRSAGHETQDFLHGKQALYQMSNITHLGIFFLLSPNSRGEPSEARWPLLKAAGSGAAIPGKNAILAGSMAV